MEQGKPRDDECEFHVMGLLLFKKRVGISTHNMIFPSLGLGRFVFERRSYDYSKFDLVRIDNP